MTKSTRSSFFSSLESQVFCSNNVVSFETFRAQLDSDKNVSAVLKKNNKTKMSDANAALLAAIDDCESKRDDIAFLYAQKMRTRDQSGISAINERILQRWSPKTLQCIKKKALTHVFGDDALDGRPERAASGPKN